MKCRQKSENTNTVAKGPGHKLLTLRWKFSMQRTALVYLILVSDRGRNSINNHAFAKPSA
jgi:hypothetical protein